MSLHRLQISHLRNLDTVDILPARDLNIIYGDNGSGKSSLLEGIHLLAQGRSFRSNTIRNVIQHNHESAIAFSDIEFNGHRIPVGIQRSNGSTRIRIAGTNVTSLSELLQLIPLQFIGPDLQKVIESGPKSRRRLLDWGVFHVEQSFYPMWLRFQKLLKQRNAALRQREQHSTICYWDNEMTKVAELLAKLREEYLEKIMPYFKGFLTELVKEENIEISIRRGWTQGESFSDVLTKTLSRDLKQGFTGNGPHRADLRFTYNGSPAVDQLSRGQLKLLVIAFKVAQIQLLQDERKQTCVILMDDLPAELDVVNRRLVLDVLLKSHAQLFVTATDRQLIESSGVGENKEKKVFHVERGLVREVI